MCTSRGVRASVNDRSSVHDRGIYVLLFLRPREPTRDFFAAEMKIRYRVTSLRRADRGRNRDEAERKGAISCVRTGGKSSSLSAFRTARSCLLRPITKDRKKYSTAPGTAPVRECRTRRARSSADFAASYMKHLLRLSRASNPEK